MKENRNTLTVKHVIFASIVIFALTIISILVIKNNDNKQRDKLLNDAYIISTAINIDGLKSLTTGEPNLNSPVYQNLKKQLFNIRASNKSFKFLYLLGQKNNKKSVFFFIDSQMPNSPDYVPLGELYNEVPDEYLVAFNTKKKITVGPVTDRWGTMITALIPIVDKNTGELITVLGLDVVNNKWRETIIIQSLPTIGFIAVVVLAAIMLFLFKIKSVEKITASEKKYRLLAETMKDVVVRISTTGEILYVSPSVEKFGGYNSEEEIGNDMLKYFAEKDDYLRAVETIKEVVETHKSGHFEFMYIPKNKVPFPVEFTYMPSITNNKVSEVQFVMRNITVRKKIEQSLKQSEAKLTESNKTKDKFFSIIAHDLRSPYNSMLVLSKMLNDNFDKYDKIKQKEFIGIINTGIQNSFKLLENLLLWSRSQEDSISFKPEKMNLYLLAIETNELLRQTAENKSIKLTNNIDKDTDIVADKNMVSIIVRNLISNAIKFTSKGGQVEINSNLVTDNNNNKFVKILIKDNGVGISKEIQYKLFDIDKNTSTRGTENERGTGLGLILCKEFAEKHGGAIGVESEIGTGSVFYFTIKL